MKGLLEIARAEGVRVRPVCPYAAAYMKRHAEERDLLA
jgi:predicted GNAT family acetyltransferase